MDRSVSSRPLLASPFANARHSTRPRRASSRASSSSSAVSAASTWSRRKSAMASQPKRISSSNGPSAVAGSRAHSASGKYQPSLRRCNQLHSGAVSARPEVDCHSDPISSGRSSTCSAGSANTSRPRSRRRSPAINSRWRGASRAASRPTAASSPAASQISSAARRPTFCDKPLLEMVRLSQPGGRHVLRPGLVLEQPGEDGALAGACPAPELDHRRVERAQQGTHARVVRRPFEESAAHAETVSRRRSRTIFMSSQVGRLRLASRSSAAGW